MGTVFDDLIDDLNKLSVEKVLKIAIDDKVLKRAAQLNRMQLRKGELSDASKFPEYADTTKTRYKRTTPARGLIKLKDTGDFHKSIYAKVRNDEEIYFDATDSKKSLLEREWDYKGATVLGLIPDHIELLINEQLTGKVGKAILEILNKK